MKRLHVTDIDAPQFKKQNGTILRLLKEQPHPSMKPGEVYGVKETWWYCKANSHYYYKSDGSNQIVWIPYTHFAFGGGIEIRYAMKYQGDLWHSPPTMPAEAIRWHIKCETTVKKLQELSEEELLLIPAEKLWFEESQAPKSYYDRIKIEFIHYWNSLHAKPIKEGDKYECYPYDRIAFTKVPNFHKYHENLDIEKGDKLGYYDTWKGKPLTIYPNPYIEVMSWEKVSDTPE